jgi:hypothetical protein
MRAGAISPTTTSLDRALLSSGASVMVTGHTESNLMSFWQQRSTWSSTP